MLDPPSLRRRKRLPSSPVWLGESGISPKVGADQVISAIYVELSQQKLGCPRCILHMKQPQVGICTSTRVFVELSKAIEPIKLLSYDFSLSVLRLILLWS